MKGLKDFANLLLLILIMAVPLYLYIINPGPVPHPEYGDEWMERVDPKLLNTSPPPNAAVEMYGQPYYVQRDAARKLPAAINLNNFVQPGSSPGSKNSTHPSGSWRGSQPAMVQLGGGVRQWNGVNRRYGNKNISSPTRGYGSNGRPIQAVARSASPSQAPYSPLAGGQRRNSKAVTGDAAAPKMLQEGHWIGLEVIPFTSQLALANKIPVNIKGVLVDEVTLTSAEQGLLAVDVICAINGAQVYDLESFKAETLRIADAKEAVVTVYRKGAYQDIRIVSGEVMGMAQVEAAPMILSTAKSPHGDYGPCDKCHTIAKTKTNPAHLAKDMGDVLITVPPPINKGSQPPHGDRGPCINCHQVI